MIIANILLPKKSERKSNVLYFDPKKKVHRYWDCEQERLLCKHKKREYKTCIKCYPESAIIQLKKRNEKNRQKKKIKYKKIKYHKTTENHTEGKKCKFTDKINACHICFVRGTTEFEKEYKQYKIKLFKQSLEKRKIKNLEKCSCKLKNLIVHTVIQKNIFTI